MKKLLLAVVLAWFTTFASAEVFQNGQNVCFLGDSITHGGIFHYNVYTYYVTRFPDRDVRMFNAGVSGDTAGGCQGRLEEDVYVKKPDTVFLMFGMNDVGRGNFSLNPTPEQLARQAGALKNHENNMVRLTQELQKHLPGVTLMYSTPSPYDDTCVNDRDNNNPGCTAGLARCGEFAKKLAAENHATLVDFSGPMIALNLEQQKKDPQFTIVGPDRVHPRQAGHLMMAYLFLKEQGAPALVSNVALSADGKILQAENATVSEVVSENGTLTFTVLENALPYPVNPEAVSVLELIPFTQDLNQETLRISGLSKDSYELSIDGKVVGTYTKGELEAGINLATNANTPQYAQAQQVRLLGDARAATERILRNYAAVRWYLRRHCNPDDLEAAMAHYNGLQNKNGYFEAKVPDYVKGWPNRAEVVSTLAEQTQAMREAARPVKHVYTIR
ncbi:MAG: SGNH/GDSL hydrolase family protein [Planctomycetia bacterium]|nr:SGNH/GDSL hydrolase family protein [Planctomycetia bacterium]